VMLMTGNESEPRVAASTARDDSIVADVVVSSTPAQESTTGGRSTSAGAMGVVARQNPVVTPDDATVAARAVVVEKEVQFSSEPDEDVVKQNRMATPDQTASSTVARVAAPAPVSVIKQGKAASLAVVQTRKRRATSSVSSAGLSLGGMQRKLHKTEEGNRFKMDYHDLGNARKHAEEADTLSNHDAASHDRVSRISDSLKTGRDFQQRQMEQKLSWACKDAKEGNRFMMDYCLGNAKKHAEEAGALNAAFHGRVSRIRDSLKTGRDFS
jgi:hypothetical protein